MPIFDPSSLQRQVETVLKPIADRGQKGAVVAAVERQADGTFHAEFFLATKLVDSPGRQWSLGTMVGYDKVPHDLGTGLATAPEGLRAGLAVMGSW